MDTWTLCVLLLGAWLRSSLTRRRGSVGCRLAASTPMWSTKSFLKQWDDFKSLAPSRLDLRFRASSLHFVQGFWRPRGMSADLLSKALLPLSESYVAPKEWLIQAAVQQRVSEAILTPQCLLSVQGSCLTTASQLKAPTLCYKTSCRRSTTIYRPKEPCPLQHTDRKSLSTCLLQYRDQKSPQSLPF